MTANRNRLSPLDQAVSAEVRAEIARQRLSISGLALDLHVRRATLSGRINGHSPFTASELSSVAVLLGTTASEITARAERATDIAERIPA